LGSGRGGGWGPSMWRLLWGSWVLDTRGSPPPEGRVPYNCPGSSDGERRPAAGEKGGLGRKGPPLGSGRGGGWGPSMWRLLCASRVLNRRGSPPPEGRVSYNRPGSSGGDRRRAAGEGGGLVRKGRPLGPGRRRVCGISTWRLFRWVLDVRKRLPPEDRVPYNRPGSSREEGRPAPGEKGRSAP
jgi:hypothetical protein